MDKLSAIPFVKDGKGRVAINCEGSVISKPTGGENAAMRNHAGRVFLPTGRNFTVLVRDDADGKLFEVCTGTTVAKAGTMCSVFVRVRGEADVGKPLEPLEPVVEIR